MIRAQRFCSLNILFILSWLQQLVLVDFVATTSYKMQSFVSSSRWESECVNEFKNRILILTQFDPMLPGPTYCFFFLSSLTFALDTQLSSLLLWFLAFLPWHYGRQQKTVNISLPFQDCARLVDKRSFPCRNILIVVVDASWKLWGKKIFSLKREHLTDWISDLSRYICEESNGRW